MNRVTIHGRLANDAKSFLVNTGEKEITMLSFSLLDYGTPNQKNEPMIIEVHFSKEIGIKLLPDLVKGKEVVVDGFLARKDYVTRSGVEKSKIYISAISFVPQLITTALGCRFTTSSRKRTSIWCEVCPLMPQIGRASCRERV